MENNTSDIENVDIKMFEDYPDILTTEDLRNALNIGKNQAYSLLKDGSIKGFRKEVASSIKLFVDNYDLDFYINNDDEAENILNNLFYS